MTGAAHQAAAAALLGAALLGAAERPLAVVLGTEARALEEAARQAGWDVLPVPDAGLTDATAKALRAAVKGTRTYLLGAGAAAPAVFYLAARVPDLWGVALALGGSPKPAIDTNRLFAANTEMVPVLWVTAATERPAMPGYNLEVRAPDGITLQQALEWLGRHEREPFPQKVDCETGNPELARCYWVEMTRLDLSLRNDALDSSRVRPGTGAGLALGVFGFKLQEAGPGLLVSWLPETYKGPLKLGDRIVAVGGKQIADAHAYLEFMDQVAEEQAVGVIIQRGKQRLRVETRIVLPKREEAFTARVRAEFLDETRELLIISRGVAELRLTLPHYWTPCPINWNGTPAGTAAGAGCWALTDGAQARPCQ